MQKRSGAKEVAKRTSGVQERLEARKTSGVQERQEARRTSSVQEKQAVCQVR